MGGCNSREPGQEARFREAAGFSLSLAEKLEKATAKELLALNTRLVLILRKLKPTGKRTGRRGVGGSRVVGKEV